MSIKIAVMTMKGGQAKTTLAINFASRIAKARRKVLLIDSDIQANITTTFKRDHFCNLANIILGKVSKKNIPKHSPIRKSSVSKI